MANITEASVFNDTIHEIGIDEFAQGGPGGTVNVQPGTLADRTRYLKEKQDVAHTATGTHDPIVVAAELDGVLENAQFSSSADISESKITRQFIGRPRPHGGGVYTST